jgi:uncharacterized protein YfkK (UPF0435 family)
MYVLNFKLKRLKLKLKSWNSEIFGNVHDYVKEAEKELQDIQDQIQDNGHYEGLLKAETLAQKKVDEALDKHEMFWKEKAKVRWHLEGDRNTSYFHKITKLRNSTKLITTLRDGDTLIYDPPLIANQVVNFYQNLFSAIPL